MIRLTCHCDKLFSGRGNQFLLEKTGTTTLDQVQVVVDLIGTVESNVQRHWLAIHQWSLVHIAEGQTGGSDETLGLTAGGHEGHAGGKGRSLADDSLDDVDDGASGANAHEFVGGEQMLLHGLVSGLFLG